MFHGCYPGKKRGTKGLSFISCCLWMWLSPLARVQQDMTEEGCRRGLLLAVEWQALKEQDELWLRSWGVLTGSCYAIFFKENTQTVNAFLFSWRLTLVQHVETQRRFNSGAARRANNADYLLTVCLCVNADCVHKVEITPRTNSLPFSNHRVDFIVLEKETIRWREGQIPHVHRWSVKPQADWKQSNRGSDGERLHTSKWMKLDTLHPAGMAKF